MSKALDEAGVDRSDRGADVGAEVWAASRRILPLPGGGSTASRYEELAALAARDLCLAKLVEPHHDATAILTELGSAPPEAEALWAVWAAEPPHAQLHAHRRGSSWVLAGDKAFCSGADMVTHALVTAETADGSRLFAIDVAGGRSSGHVELTTADWVGVGMRRADTRSLRVRELAAEPVGAAGDYVTRPGFWHGAVGVAACWLGGARAVVGLLERTARRRDLDPHGLAHLGASTATLDAATAHLHAVAEAIDRDPTNWHGARRDAQSVRATVASAAEAVIVRTGHALGPAPLAFDAVHAQRIADLQVFIRQYHAERDLADLGRHVVEDLSSLAQE